MTGEHVLIHIFRQLPIYLDKIRNIHGNNLECRFFLQLNVSMEGDFYIQFSYSQMLHRSEHALLLHLPHSTTDTKSKTILTGKFQLGLMSSMKSISVHSSCFLNNSNFVFGPSKAFASISPEIEFINNSSGVTLEIIPEILNQPMVVAEPGMEENLCVAGVFFTPSVADSTYRVCEGDEEYWFLLDCSGSMGKSMANSDFSRFESAKSALILFLKSLPVGCKFNVIGFGLGFSLLFPGKASTYNEETLSMGVKFAEELCSNMGTTDLFRPLEHIFSLVESADLRRYIILITDGSISNCTDIQQMIFQNNVNNSIFTIGIGEEVNKFILQNLAMFTGGLAEFVDGGSGKIENAVVHFLESISNVGANDIEIEWGVKNACIKSLVPPKLPKFAVTGSVIFQLAIFERDQSTQCNGFVDFGATTNEPLFSTTKFTIDPFDKEKRSRLHAFASNFTTEHQMLQHGSRFLVKDRSGSLENTSIVFGIMEKATEEPKPKVRNKTKEGNKRQSSKPTANCEFYKFIRGQRFDGSWETTEELKSLSKGISKLDSVLKAVSGTRESEKIIATLLALTVLESKYCDLECVWQLIKRKAYLFIEPYFGADCHISELVTVIKQTLHL